MRLSDWLATFLVDRIEQQRDDIALIVIDDRSLLHYPYTQPTNRFLLASVIKAIGRADPAAVGIDIALLRQTTRAADQLLAKSIRNVSAPVVVAVLDERSSIDSQATKFQNEFLQLSKALPGHAYFQRTEYALGLGDDAVRNAAAHSSESDFPISFAEQLVQQGTGSALEIAGEQIAWQTGSDRSPTTLFFSFTIQPHSPPEEEGLLLDSEPLIPEVVLNELQDRIVIVGGDYHNTDKHDTPLSLIGATPLSGQYIHAQIVAQMIDGRQFQPINGLAAFYILIIVAVVGLLVNRLISAWWLNYVVGASITLLTLHVSAKYGYSLPPEMIFVWTFATVAASLACTARERFSFPWSN